MKKKVFLACHKSLKFSILEYWNDGVLEYLKKNQTFGQYSSTPIFRNYLKLKATTMDYLLLVDRSEIF